MKVFISWSGGTAEQVALALRDWLPSVVQFVRPYVSSEDIEKGARWNSEISAELEQSDFGIVCITPANSEAPWLNFEAGALSKSIGSSRVVPFLFGLGRADLPQGPLVQFQSVLAEKNEVNRLVESINAAGGAPLEASRLDQIFEVWWPSLKASLEAISLGDSRTPDRSTQDLLAEILIVVRQHQTMLSQPEKLLPLPYVRRALGPANTTTISRELLDEVWHRYRDILAAMRDVEHKAVRHSMPSEWPEAVPRSVSAAIGALHDPLDELLRALDFDPTAFGRPIDNAGG